MKIQTVLASSTTALLVACGGGGSSEVAAPSNLTFNMDAAFATLLSTPVSFPSLSAKDNAGNTYVMSLSYTPSSNYTFNGSTYKQAIQNLTVTRNGVNVSGENLGVQYLFNLNPTKFAAVLRASRNQGFSPIVYTPIVFTVLNPLPMAASIGSTATYASGVSYAAQLDRTSTKNSTITGNSPLTWSVEADSTTTAFACLVSATEKNCLKINSAGGILGAKISVSIGGQYLTFQ